MNWCSSLALHLFFFFFWLLLYFFWFYFFVRTCSSSFSLQYDTGSNSLLVLYYLFKLNSVVLIAIGVLYVMSVNVMIAIWCRTKDMIYPRQVLTNMEMVVIYLNVTRRMATQTPLKCTRLPLGTSGILTRCLCCPFRQKSSVFCLNTVGSKYLVTQIFWYKTSTATTTMMNRYWHWRRGLSSPATTTTQRWWMKMMMKILVVVLVWE